MLHSQEIFQVSFTFLLRCYENKRPHVDCVIKVPSDWNVSWLKSMVAYIFGIFLSERPIAAKQFSIRQVPLINGTETSVMQSQLWDVKLHWQVNDSVVVTTEIDDARTRDTEGEREREGGGWEGREKGREAMMERCVRKCIAKCKPRRWKQLQLTPTVRPIPWNVNAQCSIFHNIIYTYMHVHIHIYIHAYILIIKLEISFFNWNLRIPL